MLVTVLMLFSSWGFFAHVKINELAVITLPSGISRFYKSNIQYISEHAVDPNKPRYADTAEAIKNL